MCLKAKTQMFYQIRSFTLAPALTLLLRVGVAFLQCAKTNLENLYF